MEFTPAERDLLLRMTAHYAKCGHTEPLSEDPDMARALRGIDRAAATDLHFRFLAEHVNQAIP